MSTWWKIGTEMLPGNTIEPVRVVKETSKRLTIEVPGIFGTETRQLVVSKSGQKGQYYPTWPEARDALLALLDREIACRERRLEQAKQSRAKVAALIPPAEAKEDSNGN